MKKVLIAIGILLSLVLIIIAAFIYTPIKNNELVRSFILSQEYVLEHFFEHETVYSNSFSEENWNKIHIGDAADKVIQLVGEPLMKNTDNVTEQYWYYSKQGPRNTNYHVRIIVLGADSHVDKLIKEFYLD